MTLRPVMEYRPIPRTLNQRQQGEIFFGLLQSVEDRLLRLESEMAQLDRAATDIATHHGVPSGKSAPQSYQAWTDDLEAERLRLWHFICDKGYADLIEKIRKERGVE